ncbi:TetR/AcrR family transcriptional regulator [Nakamurella silvestris]|nr:TetR/AcrR family transcriptional regulator [Nakamurella silvestris]
MTDPRRRSGAETRAAAQRVALALFISQGYEATSLRQIADELGIQKASLYYHFRNKEEIVASTMAARGAEAQELLNWARSQPMAPDLLRRTVLRWIDSFSAEKLHGIRFIAANPVLMRTLAADSPHPIRDNLSAVAEMFTVTSPDRRTLIRMAFLSINAAVTASAGTSAGDEEIIAAAREAALALVDRIESDH